jgi:hypothetical protein
MRRWRPAAPHRAGQEMVLPDRIELSTSPLPMEGVGFENTPS